MTRTTRTTITLLSTLLLALGCVELDPPEDPSAGSPGSGETDVSLAVVASAPAPNDDAVPYDEAFFVIRTNLPVIDAQSSVSLMAPSSVVPVSVIEIIEDGRFILRVTPEVDLRPATPYELRVSGGADGLHAEDGATLRNDVVIPFRTRAR